MGVQAELIVPYDPDERAKYENRDENSIYDLHKYPCKFWRGIYRRGRFPEVAVRASLKALRFSVLMSAPDMPDGGGFILTHYAGKRRGLHPAFRRMFRWFPEERIAALNRACDALKRDLSGNRGGGDPDLFVFDESGDCFFVEVKDHDELTTKQCATFPQIAQILGCDVLVARVMPVIGAVPGDWLSSASRPVNRPLQPTGGQGRRAHSTRP